MNQLTPQLLSPDKSDKKRSKSGSIVNTFSNGRGAKLQRKVKNSDLVFLQKIGKSPDNNASKGNTLLTSLVNYENQQMAKNDNRETGAGQAQVDKNNKTLRVDRINMKAINSQMNFMQESPDFLHFKLQLKKKNMYSIASRLKSSIPLKDLNSVFSLKGEHMKSNSLVIPVLQANFKDQIGNAISGIKVYTKNENENLIQTFRQNKRLKHKSKTPYSVSQSHSRPTSQGSLPQMSSRNQSGKLEKLQIIKNFKRERNGYQLQGETFNNEPPLIDKDSIHGSIEDNLVFGRILTDNPYDDKQDLPKKKNKKHTSSLDHPQVSITISGNHGVGSMKLSSQESQQVIDQALQIPFKHIEPMQLKKSKKPSKKKLMIQNLLMQENGWNPNQQSWTEDQRQYNQLQMQKRQVEQNSKVLKSQTYEKNQKNIGKVFNVNDHLYHFKLSQMNKDYRDQCDQLLNSFQTKKQAREEQYKNINEQMNKKNDSNKRSSSKVFANGKNGKPILEIGDNISQSRMTNGPLGHNIFIETELFNPLDSTLKLTDLPKPVPNFPRKLSDIKSPKRESKSFLIPDNIYTGTTPIGGHKHSNPSVKYDQRTQQNHFSLKANQRENRNYKSMHSNSQLAALDQISNPTSLPQIHQLQKGGLTSNSRQRHNNQSQAPARITDKSNIFSYQIKVEDEKNHVQKVQKKEQEKFQQLINFSSAMEKELSQMDIDISKYKQMVKDSKDPVARDKHLKLHTSKYTSTYLPGRSKQLHARNRVKFEIEA